MDRHKFNRIHGALEDPQLTSIPSTSPPLPHPSLPTQSALWVDFMWISCQYSVFISLKYFPTSNFVDPNVTQSVLKKSDPRNGFSKGELACLGTCMWPQQSQGFLTTCEGIHRTRTGSSPACVYRSKGLQILDYFHKPHMKSVLLQSHLAWGRQFKDIINIFLLEYTV